MTTTASGGIASLTTQPLDVIKTRLQTQDCLCRKDQTKMRPQVIIRYYLRFGKHFCIRFVLGRQLPYRLVESSQPPGNFSWTLLRYSLVTGNVVHHPLQIPEATMAKLKARGIDLNNIKASMAPPMRAAQVVQLSFSYCNSSLLHLRPPPGTDQCRLQQN